MPTYSKSVASIACARFTGQYALSKDLRSRCEVASTQPFALTWRGCPHCHTPAADRSIGKPLNVTFGSSLIRALNVPLARRKVAVGNAFAGCSFGGITDKTVKGFEKHL
jgi:hypothetical protein